MALQVKFVDRVGTAPGTATMTLNGNDLIKAVTAAAKVRERRLFLHPTMADMSGGLGLIFPETGGGYMETGRVGREYVNGQPAGIATQYNTRPLSLRWSTSTGAPLPPAPGRGNVQLSGGGLGYISRNWWQTGRTKGDATERGMNYPANVQALNGHGGGLGFTPGMERGYWNRTLIGTNNGLGAAGAQATFIQSPNAPNDEELSRVYGYTPVHAGWLYANQETAVAPLAGAQEDMAETQKKQYMLQLVSTVAIASLAAITIAKFFASDK